LALQSFDFTVLHKPGRLHYIPDMLSRPQLEEFCKHESKPAPLSPIFRNVGTKTTDVSSQASKVYPAYELSVDRLGEITK
ncbi:unnamed protein product, partial [Choristocarpus tenellus]